MRQTRAGADAPIGEVDIAHKVSGQWYLANNGMYTASPERRAADQAATATAVTSANANASATAQTAAATQVAATATAIVVQTATATAFEAGAKQIALIAASPPETDRDHLIWKVKLANPSGETHKVLLLLRHGYEYQTGLSSNVFKAVDWNTFEKEVKGGPQVPLELELAPRGGTGWSGAPNLYVSAWRAHTSSFALIAVDGNARKSLADILGKTKIVTKMPIRRVGDDRYTVRHYSCVLSVTNNDDIPHRYNFKADVTLTGTRRGQTQTQTTSATDSAVGQEVLDPGASREASFDVYPTDLLHADEIQNVSFTRMSVSVDDYGNKFYPKPSDLTGTYCT